MAGTHAIEQNGRRINLGLKTRNRAPISANLLLTRQALRPHFGPDGAATTAIPTEPSENSGDFSLDPDGLKIQASRNCSINK
jgi:hypothetical protein